MTYASVRSLPEGPLIAFYGDDFTGSSAAMEVLAFAGLSTVLFLGVPTPERLAQFAEMRAIGIAGTARARTPAWMEAQLPDIFRLLSRLNAPILHYKVCSTFDSSPEMGSIGKAAEIGAEIVSPSWIPMLTADPGMGRFQCFGHLFAKAGETGYRLDRHPVMARHPATPMPEADLGRHLALQTAMPVGLVDFTAMKAGRASAALERMVADGAQIVSLDVVDQETLAEAGRLIWSSEDEPIFAVGSQGVGTALVAHWRDAGMMPEVSRSPTSGRSQQIACISGSVSPITQSQIEHALANGFHGIRLDASQVVDDVAWSREVERAVGEGLAALVQGRDPLIYTATGPDDGAVGSMLDAVQTSGLSMETCNDRIGEGLGQALDTIVRAANLSRVVISGGDTSGRAAQQLGIDALTAIAPLDPGAPLCRCYSEYKMIDGLEIALKGGQVGQPDFFTAARNGGRR